MNAINQLMKALEERTVAREIGLRHDDARLQYPIRQTTVRTFDEFSAIIGDYYDFHFSRCIGNGARLDSMEAQTRAKELVEREYRNHGGDIVTAFNDSCDGTNRGLRGVLDIIADSLKAQSVTSYTRTWFDRLVKPCSWEDKVEIMRQFIDRCGAELSSSINRNQPERYASNYEELIRAYVDGLRRTSSIFRRL